MAFGSQPFATRSDKGNFANMAPSQRPAPFEQSVKTQFGQMDPGQYQSQQVDFINSVFNRHGQNIQQGGAPQWQQPQSYWPQQPNSYQPPPQYTPMAPVQQTQPQQVTLPGMNFQQDIYQGGFQPPPPLARSLPAVPSQSVMPDPRRDLADRIRNPQSADRMQQQAQQTARQTVQGWKDRQPVMAKNWLEQGWDSGLMQRPTPAPSRPSWLSPDGGAGDSVREVLPPSGIDPAFAVRADQLPRSPLPRPSQSQKQRFNQRTQRWEVPGTPQPGPRKFNPRTQRWENAS
jgi:hypothetical protein